MFELIVYPLLFVAVFVLIAFDINPLGLHGATKEWFSKKLFVKRKDATVDDETTVAADKSLKLLPPVVDETKEAHSHHE